jgi:hypothetical protein
MLRFDTMNIELRVPPDFPPRAAAHLAAVARRVPGHAARIVVSGPPALPPVASALLALQALIVGRPTAGPSLPALAAAQPENAGACDLVLDLTDAAPPSPPAPGRTVLVATFDGEPGLAALTGLLLARRVPRLAIVDVATGRELAAGSPALDDPDMLPVAMENALARVGTLAGAVLHGRRDNLPGSPRHPAALSLAAMARFAARSLPFAATRAIYRLCFHSPHWIVGWRRTTPQGALPFSMDGAAFQVVPDPLTSFYADPFPIDVGGRSFVFVEELPHRTNKGVISVIEYDANGPRGLAVPVIEEPWHLAYPHVFEQDGAVWMIPESAANRTVDLWRAVAFPHRWEKVATLIADRELCDVTPVRHNGRYYLFATGRDEMGSTSDTLVVYCAPALTGPWTPHPANPVRVDGATSRPAGAVVSHGGHLFRPAQACSTWYGRAVVTMRIDRLDEEAVVETPLAMLNPGPAWSAQRVHTFNRSPSIEVVDGTTLAPKWSVIRHLVGARSIRRDAGAAVPPPVIGGRV